MATRQFNATLQLEGQYVGDRWWTGAQIHSSWNVENLVSSDRSVWGLDSNDWLQYKSLIGSYALRYNTLDQSLKDYFFETELQPSGTGNYEVGVAFRFKDKNSFYYVIYNGGYQDWGGKNIRLMKVSAAGHTKLADYTIPVFNRNTVYKFYIDVSGAKIRVLLDGTEIFNHTDPSPIMSGAFGPIVKGQEFAKWRGFQAKSYSSFLIQEELKNNTLTSDYYDPSTSKLLSPKSVAELFKNTLETFFKDKIYDSIAYTKFTASSSLASVKVVFDRTLNKNTTTDENSKLYAYQVLPTSPPLAPNSLQGSSSSPTEILLKWKHSDPNEDGFYILDENDKIVGAVGEDVYEFKEEGLAEGTTYTRRVVAFNGAGKSASSNTVYVTTLQTPPSAPSNLSGAALSDTQIKWTWDDTSFNENQFEIIALNPSGDEIVVGVVGAGITEYVESKLSPLTEYTRWVRTKNTAGTSELSNPYTVKTKDWLPDPPTEEPVNFYGVGVADDSIVWSWEDHNSNVTGFDLLDDRDNIVAKIPKQYAYTETGLYSKMKYARKIRAFNPGGHGPSSTIASAFTLGYGYDYTGHPTEPFNLIDMDITTTSILLDWDYYNDANMPALGFRIYDELDILIDTLPLDATDRRIEGLIPGTTYTFYVVAFNELGESLPSNALTAVTDAEELDEGVVEDDPQSSQIDDPLYGLTYDKETEDTGKIKAFQSGIGDSMDLLIKNLYEENPNFEEFIYEMYIKGYYQENETVYPEVPFQFQITCSGIDTSTSQNYVQRSSWFNAMVQGSEDGPGIVFASSLSMSIPTTITSKKFSVEVRDMDGESIDPYQAHRPEEKVNWLLDPYESEEMVGVVDNIYMKNVFQDWRKFSHQGTIQPSNRSELSAWTYNQLTDEMMCLENTGTYVGAVSPDAYDNYIVDASFRSNHNDNDAMGFVVAFAIDANGREHTISAVRTHSLTVKWGLYYNFRQSNEILLSSDNSFVDGDDDWNLYYPRGTSVKISRYGDVIEAMTTQSAENEFGWKLSANLNDRPELAIFKGPQAIGVSSWSQEGASLKVNSFRGEKTERYTAYNIRAWTTYTENKADYKEWRSAKTIGPLQRVEAFEKLDFIGRIQSPQYQIPWQLLNEQFTFNPDRYKLVVTCNNPNIELRIEDPVIDFFSDSSTFVNVTMSAKIINHTQTAWNPHAHHGYYYINQQEHYLYADDRVLPERDNALAAYVYTFPYIIKAYGERNYKGGEVTFKDDTYMNFLVGNLGDGVDVDVVEEVLTLQPGAKEGVFESRLFDFEMPVTDWGKIIVTEEDTGGTPPRIEVGIANELGAVSTWYTQQNDSVIVLPEAAERIRYRLSMEEGLKASVFLMDFRMTNSALGEGYGQYIKIEDQLVKIEDPTFRPTGTYLTKPLEYGELVSDMGTLTVDINTPNDTRIDLYSVSSPDREHDFKNPTSQSPWIPLELVSRTGTKCTYKIKSTKNPWLVIAAKFNRGSTEVDAMQPTTLDADTMDATLSTNLRKILGTIKPVNPLNLARYQSRAINTASADFFAPVALDYEKEQATDRIDVYTITNDDPLLIAADALDDAKWKLVEDGIIQTPPKKWMMYRLVFNSTVGSGGPRLKSATFRMLKTAYVTPTMDNLVVQGRLFNWVNTAPRIQSVQLSALTAEGFGAQDYIVPMIGELDGDGAVYPMTQDPVDVIVTKWLDTQGIANPEEIVLKDFFVEADPIYPVELSTDVSGRTVASGRTTAPVGDLIWKQEKLYFSEDASEITLQPVPQTGSPLIITNAQGRPLRQVHFRTQVGEPTLINLEETQTDGSRYIFLEFLDVDPTTLSLSIDLNKNGKYEEIYDCRLEENRIVMPLEYPRSLNVKVTYQLKDSFCVNYNYEPNKDYAQIRVHTAFDPEIKATRQLIVKYEVKKEDAYQHLNEVNLNPLHSKINSGFLYLTDEVYQPERLNVFANPTTLYRNKEDRVTVNAYVLDEFGNPVVGETVRFTSSHGEIEVLTSVTDASGLVTAIYKSLKDSVVSEDIIEVSVIGRSSSSHLHKSITVELVDEEFVDKLSIVPEKRTVNEGDVVQLKVIAMGPSNERLVNRKIELSANIGSIVPASGTTNPDGEFFFNYSLPFDSKVDFIIFEAKTTLGTGEVLKEQNILGVSGV